jgi:hypothetical protein
MPPVVLRMSCVTLILSERRLCYGCDASRVLRGVMFTVPTHPREGVQLSIADNEHPR